MVRKRRYPGIDNYIVSDDGRVWKIGFGELKRTRTSDNYLVVTINYIQLTVHRMVLTTFVGPCPPGIQACHNNGDPTDNRLSNLRWDTPKSNSEDRVRHGTQVKGVDCHSVRLTEEEVDEIRAEYLEGGVTQQQIANRRKLHGMTVHYIVKGKTWKHLESAKLCRDYTSRRGNGWKNLIKEP